MKSIPKVLLITEKWAEYHPKSALSCTQHMLVETLQDFAGPAASIIYPDEELVNTGQTIDDVVSKSFTKSKPEYVVFDYFHSKTMSISLIEQMRAAGTKVVCIWFDTRFPEDSHKGLKPPFWTPTHEAYAKAVNLNIVFDCLVDHLGKLFVTMVVPQNKKFFNQKNNLKSFDVSFVGNVDRSAHRRETLEELRKKSSLKTKILHTQQCNQDRLSPQEYFDIYQSSKIGVNIGGTNMKARAYEILLSKALLLSDRNEVLDKFFVPFEDYVPFSGKEELVELCEKYVRDEVAREKISQAGHEKMKNHYSSIHFWEVCLEMGKNR